MAADFNAGSIEGTLDLDTRPFTAGLHKAQAEAADFSKKKVSAKADLDTSELSRKDAEATGKLDRLDHKKVTSKADLDISDVLAKYAVLSKVLDSGGLGGKTTSLAGGLAHIGLMASALLSVAAAAGPATAAVAGFGAAAGVAFAGAGIALGLFAKVVAGDMANIQKAIKAGIDLKGPAGAAETALKHLTSAWAAFQRQAGGVGYKVLTTAFTGLAGVLPKLVPLLRATGNGVNSLLKDVFALTKTPLFDHFLSSLTAFMHGFLSGAGPVLSNLLSAFMHAFIVLQPLMSMLGAGIQKASVALAHFTSGGGLKTFVGYVETAAPKVISLVGAIVHALLSIGKGLAPLAGPALHFIAALVTAVGGLHIAPLAKGLGEFLHAAEPLLPVLAQLVNIALKPLGQLLGALAHGPMAAITHSLNSELKPAFGALRGILHALVQPLAAFIGSIANLANPTGIKLAATLLKTLEGAVKTVAPAFGKLAVAVENVIDNGIETLIPLIPLIAPAFKAAAGAAATLANGLAAILSHRAVADMILGIAAAVYIGIKAYKAYVLAAKAIEFITGVFKAVEFGWAGLTVAQDANKASLIANKAAMIGFRVVSLVVAGATKAWAAAQWLLNAALDANPIGIVIVAVAALVAGLIYAYKHSETFRNIVNGAFHAVANVAKTVFNWLKGAVSDVIDFIKGHWQLLVGIMLGPLGVVVALVITHWNQIKSFISNTISSILSMIGNWIGNVVHFFASLPGKIAAFYGSLFSAGVHFFTGVFDGIKQVGGEILSWVSQLPGKILSMVSGIGGQVLSKVEGSITSSLSGIGSFISSHVHIPHLASGGVTLGQTLAMIGDNSGGREAVVPLDKYDLPKKGESRGPASAAASDAMLRALASIDARLKSLTDKTASPDDLAKAVGKQSEATMKAMVQIARAT